ncbi:MAG: 30S ribosomal protein S13 [Elusimicrobia bacterium RIFOXYA2_FULL_58_8]|nr:MAG: 30S ribosomal protein S13 [Elusimicrobia bacterium RIFOXYA2_FULL_58_8]OGS13463.1 MAG: 30S ribosomal protein S13 [Elusimicrobia bacterium RIFOXYA12_FULL_57_11]
MARIAGVDLPKEKKLCVALACVYGLGRPLAEKILEGLKNQIAPGIRVKDLNEDQVGLLNSVIAKEYKVEGELRREITANMKRYVEINSYRGYRHRRNLPSRGQRTRTNARTRRGRRRTVGAAAKAAPAAAKA